MIGLLLALQAASAGQVSDLAWLAGDWVACDGGRSVEERWIGPAGDVLIGANLSWNGKRASHEFFRVAPDATGTPTFFAQPGGRPPVAFPAREIGGQRVVFENRAHDYPQRVIYRREGQRLHARVEGMVAGKLEAEEWAFAPRTSAAGAPLCR